jgi:ribokinase
VHLVGRVGDDDMGRRLRDGLAGEGVDATHVRATPGVASGCAMIMVDPRGENSIVVAPGANARVTPQDVDTATPLLRSAAAVLLQLEVPLATVRHALALCRRLGVPTILDPAPVPERGLPRALFAADVLTPNQPESRCLVGMRTARGGRVSGPKQVATELLDRGAGAVVLKMGARGAVMVCRDGRFRRFKPFRVRVVDSTAAGDAFGGALAVAMAEGKALEEAVRFANAAGALCCTAFGAQLALPGRAAVEQLMKRG